jgi:hypothetical protein
MALAGEVRTIGETLIMLCVKDVAICMLNESSKNLRQYHCQTIGLHIVFPVLLLTLKKSWF